MAKALTKRTEHTVEEGDKLIKICKNYGIDDWKKVWDDPDNNKIKKLRKKPEKIQPGDVIVLNPPPPESADSPDAAKLAKLKSMKFWINAFIPGEISGVTMKVPQGKYKGQTMIKGPTPVNDCFLTDQRSFSNNIHANSRMHSEFKASLNGTDVKFSQWHNCDFTTECDCEDGEVECHKRGSTSALKFSFPSKADASKPIIVRLKGAASNPCFRGAPDIDYEAIITLDLTAPSIEFNGKVDAFPAFEAYATINDGAGKEMFQLMPKAGKSPLNLPGGANRSVNVKLDLS